MRSPAKNRGRAWQPGNKAQQPRPMRFGRGFFMSVCLLHAWHCCAHGSVYGGPCGEGATPAGSLFRSANPARSATLSWQGGRRVQHRKQGAIMASTPIPFGQGLRPFFDRPAHINPPPGWPYIILPAAPQEPRPIKPVRKVLADNVICLFDHDREPVANIRWRGRYPRVVERISAWERLSPGDYCVFWAPTETRATSKNHGVVVRLVRRLEGWPFKWEVKAVSRELFVCWTNDPDNPAGHSWSHEAICDADRLRRCCPPGGHAPKEGGKDA